MPPVQKDKNFAEKKRVSEKIRLLKSSQKRNIMIIIVIIIIIVISILNITILFGMEIMMDRLILLSSFKEV